MNSPLKAPADLPRRTPAAGTQPLAEGTIDSEGIGRAVRRQARLVAISAAIGALLALVVILGSVPRYGALETILLDEERNELLNQVSAMPNAQRSDAAVQSEIEILGSQVLALDVVERLDLHRDEAFMNPTVDLPARLIRGLSSLAETVSDTLSPPAEVVGEPVDPDRAAREHAASLLRENIFVERVGRSFVLRFHYSDTDPARAARIARAFGDAYVALQVKSSAAVAGSAGAWINERLQHVAAQMLAAETAVQKFRARHNLVQFNGSLLTEQQQSDLATALITASADEAQLRARLENFRALLEDGDVIAVSALETLTPSDEALQLMRTDYLDTRRRWTAIAGQTGEDHPQAQRLQTEMELMERSIAEELERAGKAIAANHQIAVSRVASLREDLRTFSDTNAAEVEVVGELAQLEAIAETYAAVYRDYLQRFELATQQENFPIASVSIISPAEMPLKPSSPKKKVLLALGLVLGALAGAAIGLWRESGPARLRTARDLRDALSLPVSGLLPRAGRSPSSDDAAVTARTLARLRADIDHAGTGHAGRILAVVAADAGGDPQAIVTICAALAEGGDAVLAVNAGGLTPGQVQRLHSQKDVEVWKPQDLRGLLPRRTGREATRDTARDGGADLRARYRHILLCLPPLTSPAFPGTLALVADASVLLVPWGQVTAEFMQDALARQGDALPPVAAAVLTGADTRAARSYLRRGDYEERLLHA
jgi:succinoglycan biosynthesis transport protein ExoP